MRRRKSRFNAIEIRENGGAMVKDPSSSTFSEEYEIPGKHQPWHSPHPSLSRESFGSLRTRD